MADISVYDQVKQLMGYTDGLKCCENCVHFVPDDCSGNRNAKRAHCIRNAFELPVDKQGCCDHHTLPPTSK